MATTDVLTKLGNRRRFEAVLGESFGGEEFAIGLPDADALAALCYAERQRAAIESFAWPLRPVTASFGVATRTPAIEDLAGLVDGADRALYASKNDGRNRVTHLEMIDGNRLSTSGRPEPSPHRVRLPWADRLGVLCEDQQSQPFQPQGRRR
jgi:PleD family two-component response regulator